MSSALEEWKKIMISLPAKAFFPIVKNYLGKIETPFHKPALIEELSAFLSREESIQRILSLIDSEDASILSSIFLLGEPSQKLLQQVMQKHFTFLELLHRLLNLEERLLIYRDQEDRIRISPLFRDILEENIISTELLFPSKPAGPAVVPTPWPSSALLAALVTFTSEQRGQLLKNDGSLRKRIIEESAGRFPGLTEERLMLFIRAVTALGCLRKDSQYNLVPVKPRLTAFAELPWREQQILLQGAVAVASDGELYPSVNECKALGERMHTYSSILSPHRSYPPESLHTLYMFTALRSGFPEGEVLRMPDLMEQAGLLFMEQEDYRKTVAAEKGEAMIVVQPDFSCTIHPDLPLEELLVITAFLDLRRFDYYSHYELCRTAFHRGSSSYPFKTFKALLEKRSTQLPPNISTIIEEWGKEFSNVDLTRGVILSVDTGRSHLVEHNPEVAPFLEKQYAPGVYLLDPEKEKEWRKALEHAGITPLPPVSGLSADEEGHDASLAYPHPRIQEDPLFLTTIGHEKKRDLPPPSETHGAMLLKDLEVHLRNQELSKDEQEDLAARIGKKLIIYPEQLVPGIGEKEKIEAKGLDYTGKVRLIERALAEGSALLEIVERTRGGSPRRLLVKPEDLRKTGTDLLLMGRSLPDEELITVTVRRISLVRKLKSSLFAPDSTESSRH
jgi:hypothetical protein